MGASGRRQDHAGQNCRHATRTTAVHSFSRHIGRTRGARGNRKCQTSAFFRRQTAIPLHRRDPPVQQIAAGFTIGRRRAGRRDADRRHDRKSVVRGDFAAVEPLSGLHAPPDGGCRTANPARPCACDRQRTQEARNRSTGDRRAVPAIGRRCAQAAEYLGYRSRCHRRQSHDYRQLRHRLPAREYRPLRQERRTALRRHFGFHQVGAGQRPQCGHLLSGPYVSRRRRTAVHRPSVGDSGIGGHRASQSERAAVSQRLLRHGTQNRHARGPHHIGRNDHLSGDFSQKQLGLHGHQQGAYTSRTRHDKPSRTAAPAQRTDQADEERRLRQRLQIRP